MRRRQKTQQLLEFISNQMTNAFMTSEINNQVGVRWWVSGGLPDEL